MILIVNTNNEKSDGELSTYTSPVVCSGHCVLDEIICRLDDPLVEPNKFYKKHRNVHITRLTNDLFVKAAKTRQEAVFNASIMRTIGNTGTMGQRAPNLISETIRHAGGWRVLGGIII